MPDAAAGQRRALWLSTIVFIVGFAVSAIFAIGGGASSELPGEPGGVRHAG